MNFPGESNFWKTQEGPYLVLSIIQNRARLLIDRVV